MGIIEVVKDILDRTHVTVKQETLIKILEMSQYAKLN